MKTMMCLGVSVNTRPLYSKNIQNQVAHEAHEETMKAYDGIYGNAAETFENDTYKYILNTTLMTLFGHNFEWERINRSIQQSEDLCDQDHGQQIDPDDFFASYMGQFGGSDEETYEA